MEVAMDDEERQAMDVAVGETKSDFKDKTKAAIEACGKYLLDNADELASEFAGGCKEWSITFSAGGDGMFPFVNILTDCSHVGSIPYGNE